MWTQLLCIQAYYNSYWTSLFILFYTFYYYYRFLWSCCVMLILKWNCTYKHCSAVIILYLHYIFHFYFIAIKHRGTIINIRKTKKGDRVFSKELTLFRTVFCSWSLFFFCFPFCRYINSFMILGRNAKHMISRNLIILPLIHARYNII